MSFIAAHPAFIALFCFALACCALLVALVWALDYTRKNVGWGYVRAPLPVAQSLPKAIGIPTAYRRRSGREL